MNYTTTVYLKSGATVLCNTEIDSSVEKDEVQDGLDIMAKFINDCIKEESSGTVHFGNTHINIQEIAAYSFSPVTE